MLDSGCWFCYCLLIYCVEIYDCIQASLAFFIVLYIRDICIYIFLWSLFFLELLQKDEGT